MTRLNFDKVNRGSVQLDIATLLGLKTATLARMSCLAGLCRNRADDADGAGAVRRRGCLVDIEKSNHSKACALNGYGNRIRCRCSRYLAVVDIARQNNPKHCAGRS